jgi:hypothetical protein
MEILNRCPFDPATDLNCQAYNHIKNLHAHSDIGEPLIEAIKPLGDVQVFSPDSYRFLTVSTKGILFGFAIGMNTIAFRLDDRMMAIARETGAKAFLECGRDWANFLPFRSDWPRIDFEFWARKAYVNARELAETIQ